MNLKSAIFYNNVRQTEWFETRGKALGFGILQGWVSQGTGGIQWRRGYELRDEKLQDGETLRDQGITKALQAAADTAWLGDALKAMSSLWPTVELTGEEIREWLVGKGLREPAHPNAWGGLIRVALNRQMLEKTGKYRAMRDPRSHGRETPVYKVLPRR